MQPSNQAIDVTIAKPQGGGGSGESGSGRVSDYNERNNSFDNVLQEQHQQQSTKSQHEGGQDAQAQSEAQVARSEYAKSGAREESVAAADDSQTGGNALPVEAEIAASLVIPELPVSTTVETASTELSPGDDVESPELETGGSVSVTAGSGEISVAPGVAAESDERNLQLTPAAEIAKPQRAAAVSVPVSPVGTPRDAGQTDSGLQRAGTGQGQAQVNPLPVDKQSLSETQAFKDAVQQLGKGNAAVATTVASTRAEAPGQAEHLAQTVLRTESLLSPPPAATAVRSEQAMTTIQVPVSAPNWGQAVAQRVMWLASNGIQAAELQLHPRELGPVDVRISVSNDQTQVQFSSQYGVVRETLESSLQRLREMFDANGLQLADVNVSDQGFTEQQESAGEEQGESAGRAAPAEEVAPLASVITEQVSATGLVDYYA